MRGGEATMILSYNETERPSCPGIDNNEIRIPFKLEGVNPEMKVKARINFRSYNRQIMFISLAIIKYSNML